MSASDQRFHSFL